LGSGKVVADGGSCVEAPPVGEGVAGASVEEGSPGRTVGEGSAAVAVAGPGVVGDGVSCSLLHAARARSRKRNKTVIRLIY
jgi:hypothetical protein